MENTPHRYRAIVIGAGKIGALLEADPLRPKPSTHAGAYFSNPKFELVGLVDINKEYLQKASSLFPNVSLYGDALECIEKEKPDIVSIATTSDTHLELLKLCVEKKIRCVICEKPLSDSLDQLQSLIDLERTDTIIILNHQRRFFPLFKKIKDKIASGQLGDIQQVTAYYSNGLLNNGTHTVDALRYLLDDEVVSVVGIENKNNLTCPKGDQNIDGLLVFKKGVVASLQSFDNQDYGIHEFRIYGKKGAVFIRNYGYTFDWLPVESSRNFAGLQELRDDHIVTETQAGGMIGGAIIHALECLNGGSEQVSTLRDGIKDLEILCALKESAQNGSKNTHIQSLIK